MVRFQLGVIDVISLLFTNIQSSVINNGFTSRYFTSLRGVRQGCCISLYLILLAVQTLAIQIRQWTDIRGIPVSDSECKLHWRSLEGMIDFIQSYEEQSGLSINTTKFSIIKIGNEPCTDKKVSQIKIRPSFQTLGVWFTAESSGSFDYDHNFKPILNIMKRCCESWGHRNISLKGKVTVINSLVISLLLCMTSVVYMPKRVVQQVKGIVNIST